MKGGGRMTDEEFRSFLNLMMCSDPWPTDDEDSIILIKFVEDQSRIRGYENWIEAFHNHLK